MAEYKSKHTGAAIDAGIDRANAALPASGGTMTGPLILSGDPAENLGAATKQYVDGEIEKIALIPGENGTTFTPSVSDEGVLTWTNNGGLANPAQANILGPKGDDGVSPAVSVAEIDGGHRVTFTDGEGEKSFDVLDGSGGGVSSWNDLTDKPFYREAKDGYILPEVTLIPGGDAEFVYMEPIEGVLVAGQSYTVVYNGAEYTCEAVDVAAGDDTLTCLGNYALLEGSGDTGHPFLFAIAPPATTAATGLTAMAYAMDGAESVVISIYGQMDVYHTIDPNYLPNENGNIVNGAALGSLRSVTSREDSSFSTLGWGAAALGTITCASGENAFATGYDTKATGKCSHAEGNCSHASGYAAHAEGGDMDGGGNFPTIASGDYSHAEGCGSRAEFPYTHAEGYRTTASGNTAHAEGNSSVASGGHSHAEGYRTTASGTSAHSEGYETQAGGLYSHAEGYNTLASGYCQHVQGKYNIEDTAGKYLHIVGNGDGKTMRANAHTLDTDGVAWFKSRPQFGGNAQDDGAQTLVANGDAQIILASPNGTQYAVTVSDGGELSVAAVTA